MRHQADIQWLEELRRNLACYVPYSSSENYTVADTLIEQIVDQGGIYHEN